MLSRKKVFIVRFRIFDWEGGEIYLETILGLGEGANYKLHSEDKNNKERSSLTAELYLSRNKGGDLKKKNKRSSLPEKLDLSRN